MSTKRLQLLAEKNYNISIQGYSKNEWNLLCQLKEDIPQSFSDISKITRSFFTSFIHEDLEHNLLPKGNISTKFEECGESEYSNFLLSLNNPMLTSSELLSLENQILLLIPNFNLEHKTDNFILRWTESDIEERNNIKRNLVIETGEYLEKALIQFESRFNKKPYKDDDSKRIEVVFYDIGKSRGRTSPNGPLEFNSKAFKLSKGIRRATTTHELFHKFQYKFGYRTKWNPIGNYKWFSEGSASLSEVLVWQQVSSSRKIITTFERPDFNLFKLSYNSLPYWFYLTLQLYRKNIFDPLLSFLQHYYKSGKPILSLDKVISDSNWAINQEYKRKEFFFALFVRSKFYSSWNHFDNNNLEIQGPNGKIIKPTLKVYNITLAVGDKYELESEVDAFGSDSFSFIIKTHQVDHYVINVQELSGNSNLCFTSNLTTNRDNLLSLAPIHITKKANNDVDQITIEIMLIGFKNCTYNFSLEILAEKEAV